MLGAGGYNVQDELGPGLFYLYARSNHVPWANYDAARTTWRNGAEKACGSSDYDELSIRESERDTGLAKQQWCALSGDRTHRVCKMRLDFNEQ